VAPKPAAPKPVETKPPTTTTTKPANTGMPVTL
jgi:hypothetical protein